MCACGAPAGPGGRFDVDGSMFGETSTVTTATVAVADSAVASVGGGALFVPVGVGASLGFLHHTSLCNFVCVCVCTRECVICGGYCRSSVCRRYYVMYYFSIHIHREREFKEIEIERAS